MSSQGPDVPDVLERLAEWSVEEIENNLDCILPELLSHLNSEDKGLVLQSVYALLVTCLPSLPVERAHECVLHCAMPAVQLLFKESLEGIELRLNDQSSSELEDIAETLSSLLQVCNEMLKCMDSVLQYIASKDQVSISSVPSVPKTVAFLMLQTFKHCRESESLYRNLFSSVMDVLAAVFRQCHMVQCKFFTVITTNIIYDSSVKSDIDHLVDVLENLTEVGQLVMSLDVKAMAEQWKGFAKIVQIYLEPLRDHLNISFAVNFLCQEICNNLEQLVDKDLPRDEKNMSRLLKTTSFILKIVIKLCEQFGSGNDCLRDCQSSLYHLLLVLHRYSPPYLIQQNVEKNLVDEVERYLIAAADPLLSHLVSEGNFREEFFRRSSEVKHECNDHLPQLSLILSTMKRLGALNVDDRGLWISASKKSNIVGCLLEVLKFSHCDLSSMIWFPAVVKPGQPPRDCDFYEALCCQCAGLVLSLNNYQFQAVESLLLDSLLEPYIWPALFSRDIWCICARVGSSELVLEHLLYFADIALALEPANLTERTDCKLLSSFIYRMCSFLSVKGKQMLVEKFPPSDHPLLWYMFGVKNFPQDTQLSQTLITTCMSNIDLFLRSRCDASAFVKMLSSLYGLSSALESATLNPVTDCTIAIVPTFISLWQHSCQGDLGQHLISSDCFVSGPKWFRNLLDVLCKCAGNLVQTMTNAEILQVLNPLDSVISCCNTSMKISVTHVLHGLATAPLEIIDQEKVCSKISSLFASLLIDEDPLVVEEVLETFEYFAHFTAHETIVAQTAGISPQIQDIVTRYLQKERPAIGRAKIIMKSPEYFLFQGSVSCEHKCTLKKVRIMSSKSPEKSAKKIKLEQELPPDLSDFLADDLMTDFVSEDISDVVSRISKDSQLLISQSSFQLLPESTQNQLKRAKDNLCKFINL